MLLPRKQIHEVLVIGSGASGGWVAKELTERGLSVVMLEAGPPRVPTRDFTEHIWPYQLKFRGFGNQQRLLETQPVQRLCYACDEYSHQFFVNDPGWREDVLLGPRKLSLQRQRIQSSHSRRLRRRLAHQLSGTRALLRPGRKLHRCERIAGGPAAITRRTISAADESFLRRAASQRRDRAQVWLARHGRPRRQPDGFACRAKGVHYIDRVTREHREVCAQVVVVAAGALESTRILLNSRSPAHAQGVGNANGVLGHYLMDHFTIEDAGGLMPGLHSSTREAVGRPCGFLIPKYVNTASSAARDRNPSFLRGYRFDGDGSQELYGHAFLMPELGDAWRKRVRGEIPYYFGIEAQGECLPRADNFVRLDSTRKDAWGIPVLHVSASYGENEQAMAASMRENISGILDAMRLTGATLPKADLSVFGKNIHECGTARMVADPKKSVVDANCKVHDAPNVFVTDGAVFTTQGCYEPTLTIMAISARAGEHIARALRRGEL